MPILDQNGNPITSRPPGNRAPSPVLGLETRWRTYPNRNLTPSRLSDILREGDETGYLILQGELFQEMEERDGKLFQLMQDRKLAGVGLDWTVEPADPSAEAKRLADAFREVWLEMSRVEVMLDLLDALGQGVSMVGMAWQRDGLGTWWPAQTEQIEARFLRWDYDQKRFLVRTQAEPMGYAPRFGEVMEHRYKARSGVPTRAGLLRTACWWYLFKHYSVKDWVVYAEVYGQPYRLGKYDPSTGKDERDALERAVVGLGTDAAGVISKDTEIEIIEVAQRGGPDVYERLVELANREMTLAILGQTLTSGEGQNGTQALGRVHQKTRLDLLEADVNALEITLRRDLIRPFIAFNFGTDKLALAPKLKGVVEESEDLVAKANVLDVLQQMGLPIPLGWVQEEFGVPAAQPKDVLLVRPAAPAIPQLPSRMANEGRVALERGLAAAPKGVLDGQQYLYELMGRGTELGAEAVSPALSRLLQEIDAASGYDDLRARLVRLYPELDLSGVSRLVEAAWTLANLAGHLAVQEDAK